MDYVAVEDIHAMQPQNGPHFNGSYTTHAHTTKQTPLPSDSESHYMEANCNICLIYREYFALLLLRNICFLCIPMSIYML